MKVEAHGAEGPVVGVAVSGFEVAGGVEEGGVPESAAEVGDHREVGPEAGDLADEEGVLVDGAESVVEGVVAFFYAPARLVDAQLLSPPHLLHLSSASPSDRGSTQQGIQVFCSDKFYRPGLILATVSSAFVCDPIEFPVRVSRWNQVWKHAVESGVALAEHVLVYGLLT